MVVTKARRWSSSPTSKVVLLHNGECLCRQVTEQHRKTSESRRTRTVWVGTLHSLPLCSRKYDPMIYRGDKPVFIFSFQFGICTATSIQPIARSGWKMSGRRLWSSYSLSLAPTGWEQYLSGQASRDRTLINWTRGRLRLMPSRIALILGRGRD